MFLVGGLCGASRREVRPLSFFIFESSNMHKEISPLPNRFGYLLLIPAVFLIGCGGGGNTTTVTGTVTHEGKKVTSGSLTFLPVSTEEGKKLGKPAAGDIKEDGSFRIEGVFIGKNTVTYIPSGSDPDKEMELKPGETVPKAPHEGLVPKVDQIDVASGSSDIQIELVDGM